MDILHHVKEEPIDMLEEIVDNATDTFPIDIKEEFNDYSNGSCNDMNQFCPIVQISELDEDVNVSVSHMHENLKKLGYKNPFVYSKLKRKKNKAKKKIWKCVICSVTKLDKDQLIEHYSMHKEAEKSNIDTQNNKAKWQCMICSEIEISKDSLLNHYETHKIETDVRKGVEIQGTYYMCSVCSAEFTSATMYDNHIELKHGESESICKLCNKPFKNLYSLCVHNFKKHSTHKIYKCTCCDFEHEDPKLLSVHLKEQHEKYSCEVCKKSFTTLTWYEEHKNFHKGQTRLKCEICPKTFPYARNLVAHKKKNHPETFADLSVSYSCKYCDVKFPNMKSLASHIRSHNGPSSLLCDLCGKSLSCYDHLKKHLRIHRGEKPFKCDVCGKGFSDKCNLKLHERVHSGEKPYVCNVCKKGFSQRSSLVIHGRLHSGERPYRCDLCDKGFVAKGLLGVHRKSCMGFHKIE